MLKLKTMKGLKMKNVKINYATWNHNVCLKCNKDKGSQSRPFD
jgi:hypothetical protein